MNAEPGATAAGCVTVTYGGPPARIKLYGATAGTGLDPYVTLTITRGTATGSSPGSCATFSPDEGDYLGFGAGVVYRGSLAAFPDSWEAADHDPGGAPHTWNDGESHAYRFHVVLDHDNAAQGLSVVQSFTWEARPIP